MIYVKTFDGIGDNLMSRPYIRAAAMREKEPLYIETPIPQLYQDISNLKFVKPETQWRTQKKILSSASDDLWEKNVPHVTKKINLFYGASELMNHTIFNTFESLLPTYGNFVFDLPKFPGACTIKTDKPIAIIRPVTLRKEWMTPSRAPDPEYINWICAYLKAAGFLTVSIADVVPNQEWIHGRENNADIKLHSGELSMKALIDLFNRCAISVGGVGFVTPFGIASGNPHYILFGGRGKFDCIANITDPKMNLSKVGWLLPDKFCRCDSATHECSKQASNVPEKFIEFLKEQKIHNAFAKTIQQTN